MPNLMSAANSPHFPQTVWQKQPSPFVAASDAVVAAILETRQAAIDLHEGKQAGQDCTELHKKLNAAYESWDKASLEALAVANDFFDLQRIYRSTLPGSPVKQVVWEKMTEFSSR